ncbi:DUF6817 domain-containing protein [Streptomyces sp. NPDC093261]|uniref:DUF6817 domain-containing protein n=1 Tax=Streptomyces sp. NPDC093261 TaxID=3366037 RepID=UPI0038043E28
MPSAEPSCGPRPLTASAPRSRPASWPRWPARCISRCDAAPIPHRRTLPRRRPRPRDGPAKDHRVPGRPRRGPDAASGGTLLEHLVRVARLLSRWGAEPDVRVAGLCHVSYATAGFDRASWTWQAPSRCAYRSNSTCSTSVNSTSRPWARRPWSLK